MATRLLKIIILNVILMVHALIGHAQQAREKSPWPVITSESKPWTRWWWHGSAVTHEGITHELELFAKAGFGGVEITPIYGAYGHEEKFISYLSPKWLEALAHTLKEAQRLGLGVDMATGTGWPFGGPWISNDDACRNVKFKSYDIAKREDVPKIIEYTQEPLLRRVGFNIPGTSHASDVNDITRLRDPVHQNKDLQILAIDQVRFEKRLPLIALMAYDDKGNPVDLTGRVDEDGTLSWKYPGGKWRLIAAFTGWHGKMVERAGPGGEGNVIDHFSVRSLNRYLTHFDSAFRETDIKTLRAFFNDSYEVDDAAGAADWTPDLLAEFKKRRGYDLRNHFHELLSDVPDENANRILCDYRETISELLLENFTIRWREWAHKHGALVRNQAHGSPANILDLYSAVDIPEIEGEEPLRIRMASSAGNVSGKKLTAAEAATWLDEHFSSNLWEVKTALDRFMVNGINHLVYHGTAYSPAEEPWPGWLFYAAVHFNPRNPFWRDIPALNQYVARCQSFLQNSTPDNDVLVYYPVYDRFSTPGPELIEHFDGIGKQFDGTSFGRCAETLLGEGYAFDFISDMQISELNISDGKLRSSGNSTYRVLAIPRCKFIPAKTLTKIQELANAGATIVFFEGLPDSFSGRGNLQSDGAAFREFKASFASLSFEADPRPLAFGKGRVIGGTDIRKLMATAAVKSESLAQHGINYIRKNIGNKTLYFIVNDGQKDFEGDLQLSREATSIEAFDPMTGESGKLVVNGSTKSGTSVYLHLASRQSMILILSSKPSEQSTFPLFNSTGKNIPLSGPWTVEFLDGGPTLPKKITLAKLTSWTALGTDHANHSGSAKYTIEFSKPATPAESWKVDLGEVKESASVYLNGQYAGTCIGPGYSLIFDGSLMKDVNRLEVIVSNSMANRIAFMDRQGIKWKRFYNINFPARKQANAKSGLFDASQWTPAESGLLGPVRLTPVRKVTRR